MIVFERYLDCLVEGDASRWNLGGRLRAGLSCGSGWSEDDQNSKNDRGPRRSGPGLHVHCVCLLQETFKNSRVDIPVFFKTPESFEKPDLIEFKYEERLDKKCA
jgi:hypothetical protein